MFEEVLKKALENGIFIVFLISESISKTVDRNKMRIFAIQNYVGRLFLKHLGLLADKDGFSEINLHENIKRSCAKLEGKSAKN